jgi:hypothetical protein
MHRGAQAQSFKIWQAQRTPLGHPMGRYVTKSIGTLVTKLDSIWCRTNSKGVQHQNDRTAHAFTAVPAFKARR